MSADYIMVGGFLGAGKTTAMLRLAEHFTAQGRRVGLDHQRSEPGPGRHVDGHRQGLSRRGDHRRLLLLPLQLADRRRRSPDARRAPGRVPRRAGRQLHRPARDGAVSVAAALRRRLPRRAAERARRSDARGAHARARSRAGRFSPKVLYVYEKQLEEADIIVINKSDLLSAAQREALERALEGAVPAGRRRDGERADRREPRRLVRPAVRHRSPSRPAMDVDYDVYAEGEALLGWLNATCRLSAPQPFDGNRFLQRLADGVQRRLADRRNRDRALQDDARRRTPATISRC